MSHVLLVIALDTRISISLVHRGFHIGQVIHARVSFVSYVLHGTESQSHVWSVLHGAEGQPRVNNMSRGLRASFAF